MSLLVGWRQMLSNDKTDVLPVYQYHSSCLVVRWLFLESVARLLPNHYWRKHHCGNALPMHNHRMCSTYRPQYCCICRNCVPFLSVQWWMTREWDWQVKNMSCLFEYWHSWRERSCLGRVEIVHGKILESMRISWTHEKDQSVLLWAHSSTRPLNRIIRSKKYDSPRVCKNSCMIIASKRQPGCCNETYRVILTPVFCPAYNHYRHKLRCRAVTSTI